MDIFSLQQAMAARALLGTAGPQYQLGAPITSSPTLVAKPWVSQTLSMRALDTPSPASSCQIESKFKYHFTENFINKNFMKF